MMQFFEPADTAGARDSTVDRTGPETVCVCNQRRFRWRTVLRKPVIASEIVNEDVLAGLLPVAL